MLGCRIPSRQTDRPAVLVASGPAPDLKSEEQRVVARVKGMYDIIPEESGRWQWIERNALDVLSSYGYREIRLPILEQVALFAGAIGESTDVVSKEMYAFEDRGGDVLALRPEGTAGCVRAVIGNGLLQGHAQKLWYSGPMFRRERPQRGRNRQFYQIGAEAFGLPGPDVDAEQIVMLGQLWRQLGLRDLKLEINSLGTAQVRRRYRDVLVAYLTARHDELDEDSRQRLDTNPLRVLDSKNPAMKPVIDAAPSLLDHLDDESARHFETLQEMLRGCEVGFEVNPRLVRGLDYYSRTVFEWISGDLGAQGTVCAGGRYDSLVESQGGKSTPALGFAMGVDRLVELSRVQQLVAPAVSPDAYLVLAGEVAAAQGVVLAERLRRALPALKLECNLGGGSMKAQFKRADRSGALLAIIVGDDELSTAKVQLKPLRSEAPQISVKLQDLPDRLTNDWLRSLAG